MITEAYNTIALEHKSLGIGPVHAAPTRGSIDFQGDDEKMTGYTSPTRPLS